ncbi:cilia- and flagella-associated protein 337-like [Hyperolius riggenbachi]|uniref:cilia- and flagella-associated protein 337-like n=1 Tax=Hyperolius riggenbachi TaxID=752182 RepID=UPI0035A33ABA
MPLPPVLQKRVQALQRQQLSNSLIQELEVFLKRQGAQKYHTRHLSFSDEENVLSFDRRENMRLEEKFRLDDLLVLEEVFANHNLQEEQEEEIVKKKKAVGGPKQVGNMTLKEFQKVLSDLFGSEDWDDNMELLFNKVDTSCDGLIDWSEFCTYMLLQYKERDYVMTQKVTFLGEPVIRLCTRSKQEPTIRVLAIGSSPQIWFLSVSKGGVLTAWDSELHPLKAFEISSDPQDSQAGKRRFKSWVTDAVYLSNVHKIAVATTSRNIHFFDATTMNLQEEFYLSGLLHAATCFSYWCNVKASGSPSLLLWGDEKGGVNLLWLLKPNYGLFEKPFTQQAVPYKISMKDLRHQSNFLSFLLIPDIHSEPINRLMFVPDHDLIITASGNPHTSLVIMDIHGRGKVYTWKIPKGVQCFDYCKAMNLLVTGGLDHKVRLWNQYVPIRPIAVLSEHTMPIQDVAIYEPLRQILSFSKDSVLKVWDLSSHSCLQTLFLKFPCVQAGRIQEQGNFPFLLILGPPYCLLVTYSDYIGMLKLAQNDLNEESLVTHGAPLSAIRYNRFFHQVVTASEDSSVVVWDVETGNKFLLLNNVHGKEEVTCLAFDTSQRKLMTGARNGSIKVWNIQNGHNLHRLQPTDEAEVTCVLPLRDHKFLSAGWNRKIVTYDISNTEKFSVLGDDSWKGGHLHKDDILAADYCPSLSLLATASFDGEIIIWNPETQRLYLYLRRCPPDRSPPPVDRLLFLQQRAAQKYGAFLVSSEGGDLRWWSLVPPGRMFGSFYAPGKEDESVFGIASDENNKILVSGDTSGSIHIWDISQYGLQAQNQKEEQRPPLLCSWTAHRSTVIGLEIFLCEAELFIISGSSDRTAKLWSSDGRHVGTFGQSRGWNLRNPASFQHNMTTDKRITQASSLMTEEALGQREGVVESSGGTVYTGVYTGSRTPEVVSELLDEKTVMGNEVPETDFLQHAGKASAARGQRKHLGVDINKCNHYAQICSPFQALNVTDMQEVPSIPHTPPSLGTAESWWQPKNQERGTRQDSRTS